MVCKTNIKEHINKNIATLFLFTIITETVFKKSNNYEFSYYIKLY